MRLRASLRNPGGGASRLRRPRFGHRHLGWLLGCRILLDGSMVGRRPCGGAGNWLTWSARLEGVCTTSSGGTTGFTATGATAAGAAGAARASISGTAGAGVAGASITGAGAEVASGAGAAGAGATTGARGRSVGQRLLPARTPACPSHRTLTDFGRELVQLFHGFIFTRAKPIRIPGDSKRVLNVLVITI